MNDNKNNLNEKKDKQNNGQSLDSNLISSNNQSKNINEGQISSIWKEEKKANEKTIIKEKIKNDNTDNINLGYKDDINSKDNFNLDQTNINNSISLKRSEKEQIKNQNLKESNVEIIEKKEITNINNNNSINAHKNKQYSFICCYYCCSDCHLTCCWCYHSRHSGTSRKNICKECFICGNCCKHCDKCLEGCCNGLCKCVGGCCGAFCDGCGKCLEGCCDGFCHCLEGCCGAFCDGCSKCLGTCCQACNCCNMLEQCCRGCDLIQCCRIL